MSTSPTPGTCSACAHWGQERPGVCGAANVAYSDTDDDTPEPNGATVSVTGGDQHGVLADLITGPAFGCNRFALRCPVCKGGRGEMDARGYWVGPCKACNGTGCAEVTP